VHPVSNMYIPVHPAGAVLEEEAAEEVLPAAGLVTASADYYPTVAINALMRTLRDSVMAPHHAEVVRALFYIFTVRQGLDLGFRIRFERQLQLQQAEVVRAQFCILTVGPGLCLQTEKLAAPGGGCIGCGCIMSDRSGLA
jgi:Domain of unknown function (DUF3385)